MNRFPGRLAAVLPKLVIALCLSVPGLAAAQQKLSVEELESYIAEQKAALEAVRANRDETERKAQEIRDALAEQEARRALVEEELETLCKEQEALKPGSYETCTSQSDS
jgi:cell division protein FtsB